MFRNSRDTYMRPVIGLDFGTTNSAVAVADVGKETTLARFNDGSDTTTSFRSILIKSYLGSRLFTSTQINGRYYTLEDLIAITYESTLRTRFLEVVEFQTRRGAAQGGQLVAPDPEITCAVTSASIAMRATHADAAARNFRLVQAPRLADDPAAKLCR